MQVVRTISAIRRLTRAAHGPIVLVPTMGALHAGHAALMDRARRLAGPDGMVVVSIFVNPTQFGPKEDFNRYPRTLAEDRCLCTDHGADVIFQPAAAEMYASHFSTWVTEESVSRPLCGTTRPGHFRGVTTVVLMLFTIVQPTIAVFGLKDFQQCAVICRMVRDLHLRVRIVPVKTVRESDGLALSSRNRYLSAEERAQAPILRKALLGAEAAFRSGETSAAKLRKLLLKIVGTASLARVDYIDIRDAGSLEVVKVLRPGCVMALAVFFGKTRLIDNLWVK